MAHRPTNDTYFVPFSTGAFEEQVRKLRLPPDRRGFKSGQVEYLGRYLESLGTRTLIIETHYVDRHFTEEYAAYYSRSLVRRPNACARIHAFDSDLDETSLETLIARASESAAGRAHVQSELQTSYLGYVVVRPVPSVPIGRTVLKPLDDDPARYIKTTVAYTAHVLGFKLQVEGLAFQEQDRAVAACATTAAWVALQRARRRDGGRPPSPHQITEAAVSNVLEGRPYPSQGLDILQITDALRQFDFPPDVITAQPDPGLFWLLLQAYLRSRIPAVLALPAIGDQPAGHAVTALGYRKSDPSFSHLIAHGATLENAGFDQIYYHDDQLGPYARAKVGFKVFGVERNSPVTYPVLHVERQGHPPIIRPIHAAIIPLYAKLRSNARELWTSALQLLPVVDVHLASGGSVGFEFFFTRSGTYLRRLYDKGLKVHRVFDFQRTVALSRYVGIVRYSVDGQPVLDALWDTTDTVREETRYGEHLLALVARDVSAEPLVDLLAKNTGAIAG